MKKSFFYRVMALSIGALLAGIIACKNPASPDPVNPEQNVQTPSDNGLGGGGTPNPKPGEPTPGGGGGGDGPAPTPNPVNPQTDQERVEAAKAVLKLRVNGKVSNWINLPSRGAYDTSISWTSSPIGIIKTNKPDVGKVTRQEDDTEVTLTATITKGSATATKTFTVTVYGKNQELVDQVVQNMQQPPAFVMGSGTSTIMLQKTYYFGHPDNAEFEWKAQPEGSVTFADDPHNPSKVIGTVIQPEPPAEKKTVTLTATAKKGNATASRTFTVIVYPKNQTPSLDELLTQIMATVPAATDKDIPLISTVASGYHLAWATPNNSVLEISGNYAKIITRDLVDRKATLKAELSKGGSPSETAQKEKEVTVKAQTKFDNCELAGDLLTMKGGDGTATAVYRVQINADAKTITAAAEKVAVEGTLMTLDAAKRQQLARIDTIIQAYRSLLSLCDKETVTLQDIKEAVIQMNPGTTTMSDEEAFEWITDKKESYDDFKDKNAEEKSQFLKSFLNKSKTEMYRYLSLPPDAPLEQALAQMKEQQIEYINTRIENAKKQHIYTYSIKYDRLDTEAPYVSGAPWYRQERGSYSFWDNSDNIKFVKIYGRLQNDGKYEVSIGIRKKDSERSDWFSASGYDGSGAITAKNRDDKQITVTVTEKGPRKAEVVCTGEISFTKELTFRGYPIPDSPLWN